MELDDIAQRTSEAFKNVGVNLLASVSFDNVFSVGGTLIKIPGFEKGFTSSGGLVVVIAHLSFEQAGSGAELFTELRIDGREVQKQSETNILFARGDQDYVVPVKLNEGKHKVEIFGRAAAGTTDINKQSDQASYLYIVEFLGV